MGSAKSYFGASNDNSWCWRSSTDSICHGTSAFSGLVGVLLTPVVLGLFVLISGVVFFVLIYSVVVFCVDFR